MPQIWNSTTSFITFQTCLIYRDAVDALECIVLLIDQAVNAMWESNGLLLQGLLPCC
jgi:hypothetical protein